jgi:hypothetical protein
MTPVGAATVFCRFTVKLVQGRRSAWLGVDL